MKSQREYNQEYYAKNRDRERARTAKNYREDPTSMKLARMKQCTRVYGWKAPNISLEAFRLWYNAAMFVCDGKCPCCGNVFGEREPHIDHDHETGELRTLLCMKCNFLESFDVEHLKKASEFFAKPFNLEG